MRAARVTFANGHEINTSINGTDEEIRSYYRIGRRFNVGGLRWDFNLNEVIEVDDLQPVITVEIFN